MSDQKPQPKVSVIMANYNGASHIETAVHSVLAQSMADLELLISDDASTDNSVALARAIAQDDRRVQVFNALTNSGPAAARNRALNKATGGWIAIVDSDDIIHPQRLEKLLATANRLNTDGVADDLIYFGENASAAGATLLGKSCPQDTVEITPAMLVEQGRGGHKPPALGYLKPLLRKSSLGNLRYREDIRIGEDHDFYLRYLLEGGRMHLVGQSYYLYRRHPASTSHRLHPDNLASMIKVQSDLLIQFPNMSEELKNHLSMRQRALSKVMAIEAIFRDVKNRKFLKAAASIVLQPTTLPHLGLAVREHFQKRTQVVKNAEKLVPTDIVFQTDEEIRSGVMPNLQGATVVTIPAQPDHWSSKDWAQVTAAFQTHTARVFATGSAGLFALGYSPHWGCAILGKDSDGWPHQAEHLVAAGYAKKVDELHVLERPETSQKRREILLLCEDTSGTTAHAGSGKSATRPKRKASDPSFHNGTRTQ